MCVCISLLSGVNAYLTFGRQRYRIENFHISSYSQFLLSVFSSSCVFFFVFFSSHSFVILRVFSETPCHAFRANYTIRVCACIATHSRTTLISDAMLFTCVYAIDYFEKYEYIRGREIGWDGRGRDKGK